MGENHHSVTLRCSKNREENERCICFSLNLSLLKSYYLFFGALIHSSGVCSALDLHYSSQPADEGMQYTPVYLIILLGICFIDHRLERRRNRSCTKPRKIRGEKRVMS